MLGRYCFGMICVATFCLITIVGANFPAHATGTSAEEENEYIVTLKEGVNIDQHFDQILDFCVNSTGELGDDLIKPQGINYRWSIPGFRAYAGRFDRAAIEKLKKSKDVAAVEKDEVWTFDELETQTGNELDWNSDHNPEIANSTIQPAVQKNAPWHLNQISHREPGSKEGYVYFNLVSQPRVYVIDSGINTKHVEFSNRALKGTNAARRAKFDDELGHGTHVASLIGGHKYGVMKQSILIDVKVDTPDNRSRLVTILNGYTWALHDIITKHPRGFAVVTMCLSPSTKGTYSYALNRITSIAFAKGVVTVASAGNHGQPTHWGDKPIVVGTVDKSRRRLSFSNHGPRVDIFAPGKGIQAAWIGPNNNEVRMSKGTSAAAAQVAGVVAYLKTLRGVLKARETKDSVLKTATVGVVADAQGAQNRFLYNGSGR